MKIYNLIEKELEKLRIECNFTDEERECYKYSYYKGASWLLFLAVS